MRGVVAAGLLALVGVLGGCGATGPRSAAGPSPAAHPATARPGAPASGWPAYASSTAPVTMARLGPSWHAGCPVGPEGLRLLTVRYAGFDGRAHDGELVLAAGLTDEVAAIFAELYRTQFPIRLMRTVDAYGGSDDDSMAADNTSAFNCRPVTGGTEWSEHAYGRAIDVNPRENPYVSGGTVLPPGASVDRTRTVPGMVTAAVVAAFGRRGWAWGGAWTDPVDYQHFQKR